VGGKEKRRRRRRKKGKVRGGRKRGVLATLATLFKKTIHYNEQEKKRNKRKYPMQRTRGVMTSVLKRLLFFMS
jgi:hypothetical protein